MSVSLIAFEAMSVATILPVAAREIGGLGGYGWAFSAFMLANLVGAVAAGQRADARGPASPFTFALLFFGAGLATAGLAQSWAVLVLGRALQGLGGGAVMTLALYAIRRGYPEDLRARMFALVSSAWVLPSLLGPAVAGALAEHGSWRWVFLGLLPTLVPPALLTLPALRRMGRAEEREPAASRRRLLFAAELALGAGVALLALELRSWFAVALGLGGLALALHALRGLLPPGTLSLRAGLPAGLALRGLLGFVYFGSEAFTPLALGTLRGLSPSRAGLVLTGAAISWVSGSWLQARMDERDHGRSRRLRVVGGFATVLVGIAVMAVAMLVPAAPVAVAMGGWVVAGFGMGLGHATGSAAVIALASSGEEGHVSSSLSLCEGLGIAVGAGLSGAALDAAERAGWTVSSGFALAFAIALAPGIFGLLAGARLFRR